VKTPIADPVATADFLMTRPGGEVSRVTVRIGRPYVVSDGEARCPVEVRGLDSQYPDISGTDTLHALVLAISLVRRRLEHALDTGCSLADPDGGDAYSRAELASLFAA
jgi:hypothetical protein